MLAFTARNDLADPQELSEKMSASLRVEEWEELGLADMKTVEYKDLMSWRS